LQTCIDAKTYRVKEVRFARVVFADDARRAVRDRHIQVLERPKILDDNSAQAHAISPLNLLL
jgi:hypothetical protein